MMGNKETGESVFFDKDKNGLDVAPLSDVSNGACLLSTVQEEEKCIIKGKLLEQRKPEFCTR